VRIGEEKWESRELAQGSLIYADSRLYVLSEKGVMALLKPGPAFEMTGRFNLTDGRKSDAWAHPVILDGRLYLRYQGNLYCYDIRRPPG
jgi:outer membrane protein assembly factor BamB